MSNLIISDDNEVETFITDEEDKENRSYKVMINQVSEIVKEVAEVEDECQMVKESLILDKKSPIMLRQRIRHDSKDRRDTRRTSYAGLDAGAKDVKIDPNLKKCTLYDYIYQEVRRTYLPENDEARYIERREKFYMFLKIPRELEKFIWFGFLQCLDAFLSIFTLLPLRFLLSLWFIFFQSTSRIVRPNNNSTDKPILQPAEICDFLKGVIVIFGAIMLSYLDTSMLYHIIKSQSVIKLYIFFNMLELAEKLITSFGLDILDALYWTATEPRGRRREHIGVIPHLAMAIIYIFVHTIIILLQATTLNVAINSSNKALLTIMMSNNFVEIKGMVFKKFEKNNLFHMSCYDVKERFHLLILLIVVVIQTMKEYSWEVSHFWILLPDCFFIFLTEFGVDWVKHCFVTRFNDLSYEVYHAYTVSLSYDLAGSNLKSAFSDHIDLISKRVGFIPLPLGILLCRIFYLSVPLNSLHGYISLFLGYLCIVTLKIWLNILLLGKSFEYIESYRIEADRKKNPPSRQCASLPSSRHQSLENIPASLHCKSTLNISGL